MSARIERLVWQDIPLDAIDLPKSKLQLTLGLGSGLSSRGGRIFAVTDRGPNLFVSQAVDDYGLKHLDRLRGGDAKIMPMPHNGAEIAELAIDGDTVRLVARMPLRTVWGQRLSGVALPGGEMEAVHDLAGELLPPSALGADTEAIAAMPDGSFFVAEEYGPSILKVDEQGVVTERWVAESEVKTLAHEALLISGVLPKRVRRRRRNRGFEGLCASADGKHLYVGVQSALKGEDEQSVPIWRLDARTGELEGEYLYPFDDPSSFHRDACRRKVDTDDLKICELAWAGKDKLIVLERISHSAKIYLVSVNTMAKQLLVSSDNHPEIGPDIEGMTLLSPTQLLICSDNDFGVEGAETGFWRITLDSPLAD